VNLLLSYLRPFLFRIFFRHSTLPHSKTSVINIYRPPLSSAFSKLFSVFLDEFSSFLSTAATTPREFLITGDFNLHLDETSHNFLFQFLCLLPSSFNLTLFPNLHKIVC